MISHFSDHAANERTFLAWVRTAIAVMAFGFLVARFDLFLKITTRTVAPGDYQADSLPRVDFGSTVGAALIIAGTVMVVLAAVRFARTRRAIDDANPSTNTAGADLALAAMMTALGVALLLYLVHALLNGV